MDPLDGGDSTVLSSLGIVDGDLLRVIVNSSYQPPAAEPERLDLIPDNDEESNRNAEVVSCDNKRQHAGAGTTKIVAF